MKNYKEIVAWGLTISFTASVVLVIMALLSILGAVNLNNVVSLATAAIGLTILFFIAGTFVNDWDYEDYDE